MTNNIPIEDQYKRTSIFEKNVNYLVRVLKDSIPYQSQQHKYYYLH
jgi:hypothetical protein